jgi:hypothetical protein
MATAKTFNAEWARVEIAHDADNLSRALTAAIGKHHQLVLRALRKIALDALARIILRNPVDTGRCRAGWTAYPESQGMPVSIGGREPAGIAEGKALSSYTEMLTGNHPFIEVHNGVRYVVALEYGWSRQAPQGMVRVTLREMTRELLSRRSL